MTRILVVDDDPDFCEIARLILQREGYEVESALDGQTAMIRIRQDAPDLILLDVMMTGVLDGVSLAHAIESAPELHHIPIIMVSSIASSPMSAMFPTDEYLPIDAWLSKPVSPETLIREVGRLVGSGQRHAPSVHHP